MISLTVFFLFGFLKVVFQSPLYFDIINHKIMAATSLVSAPMGFRFVAAEDQLDDKPSYQVYKKRNYDKGSPTQALSSSFIY